MAGEIIGDYRKLDKIEPPAPPLMYCVQEDTLIFLGSNAELLVTPRVYQSVKSSCKDSFNPLGNLGSFAATRFWITSYDKPHVHSGELG